MIDSQIDGADGPGAAPDPAVPAVHGGGDRPPISVVVPVRNEAGTLEEIHRRLRESLPAGSEIVFVDDGSTDASGERLASIRRDDPDSRALRFLRGFGKSRALAAGFRRARGALVGMIDADLQERPEDIVVLARELRSTGDPTVDSAFDLGPDGVDIVSGWRRRRNDRPLKVIGSRVFNGLAARLAGIRLRDMNCGLKVMRRTVIESIPMEGGFHRFIPVLAHWKGFRVLEVEIPHAPRAHGQSNYGRVRILHGLIDLAVLLFLERFEARPSRFFLGSGAGLFLTGFGISAYIALLKLGTGTIQSRYPLLVLGVLLLVVGTQLVSMGLLAELVAHQGRRRLSVDEPSSEEIPAAPPVVSHAASPHPRSSPTRDAVVGTSHCGPGETPSGSPGR